MNLVFETPSQALRAEQKSLSSCCRQLHCVYLPHCAVFVSVCVGGDIQIYKNIYICVKIRWERVSQLHKRNKNPNIETETHIYIQLFDRFDIKINLAKCAAKTKRKLAHICPIDQPLYTPFTPPPPTATIDKRSEELNTSAGRFSCVKGSFQKIIPTIVNCN